MLRVCFANHLHTEIYYFGLRSLVVKCSYTNLLPN